MIDTHTNTQTHTQTHRHTHTHTLEYFIFFKKKKILTFGTTQMNLKNIILSEISQTQRDKYPMISLICGIKKKKKVELTVSVC